MSEKEIIPESGRVDETKLYIGEDKVKEYRVLEGATTPSGSRIIEITLAGGKVIRLTEPNFDAVKSYQKSDATEARNKLIRVAGQKLYALIMEYGPKLPEVNLILDEAVRLTNDATEAATNSLWGVQYATDRTILQVNEILMKEYGKKTVSNDKTTS